MKLTETQRAVLEDGHTIVVSQTTGRAYRYAGGCNRQVVRQPTFMALLDAGYIAKSSTGMGTDYYRITEAGRAALLRRGKTE